MKLFNGSMSSANKVAFNSIILYVRMLITMGISLYSTRLVLSALGVSDYGLYSLIAGIISMLSFLNAALTTSTQRYLSFYQGQEDVEMQKKVFINSWILHIVIASVIAFLLYILMPIVFSGFLTIPIEKMSIAKTLYQFMIFSVFLTILSTPFTAVLNAHEDMLWSAIVNVGEALFKLAIAFLLFKFFQYDRLLVYGLLMAGLSLLSFLSYSIYSTRKFQECTVLNYKTDKTLMKDLGSFAGWNLLGVLTGLGRNQGLAVLLNFFFTTIVNASFGIANQLLVQLNFFSATMLRVLNPQIMKSEGMGDRERMLRLSLMACKFGFFLLAFIAVPSIFEMKNILKFWLKEFPEDTVVFSSLILVASMIMQLTIGLQSAFQATGKIKVYLSIISAMAISNLPIGYYLLSKGFPAYSVLISYIAIEFATFWVRIFLLKRVAGLSVINYFNNVFLKILIPLCLLLVACYLVTTNFSFEFRFFVTFSLSALVLFVSVYFFGLCKDEKILVDGLLKKIRANRK